MANRKTDDGLNCDFCDIPDSDLTLVRGLDNVMICEVCVEEAHLMIQSQRVRLENKPHKTKLTPAIIKKHLDKSVAGQDRAKRLLSIAVYNHYKRINHTSSIDIQKSNVLLVGPSGSGKTFLAKQISKLLSLPLAIADASAITKAGYVGEDVQSILSRLLIEANGDVKLAEKGIIFLDEFDKLAKSGSLDGKRDISGDVQNELLKIIEGDKVFINPEGSKKSAGGKEVVIDTTNILFICGGAFSGIMDQKSNKAMGIGGLLSTNTDSAIDSNDLIKYGFLPEIIGRLPIIAQLNALTHSDMRNILCGIKNSLLDEYKELFKIDQFLVTFSDEFIDSVIDLAMKSPTGARSLRSILESKLEDLMFKSPEMSGQAIVITGEIK